MAPATYRPNIHARGEHAQLETDLVLTVAVAAGFLLLRWILLTTVVRPFAIRMMGCSGQNLEKSAKLGVEKFCKYGWHFIAYLVLFLWGIKLLLESQWSVFSAGNLEDVCLGYPHSGSEKIPLKAFFVAQIAWYLHGLVESLIVDRSRNDFVLMLVHHVLAIALLTGAFWGNAHRIGVTVCVFQVRFKRLPICHVTPQLCQEEKKSPGSKSAEQDRKSVV